MVPPTSLWRQTCIAWICDIYRTRDTRFQTANDGPLDHVWRMIPWYLWYVVPLSVESHHACLWAVTRSQLLSKQTVGRLRRPLSSMSRTSFCSCDWSKFLLLTAGSLANRPFSVGKYGFSDILSIALNSYRYHYLFLVFSGFLCTSFLQACFLFLFLFL